MLFETKRMSPDNKIVILSLLMILVIAYASYLSQMAFYETNQRIDMLNNKIELLATLEERIKVLEVYKSTIVYPLYQENNSTIEYSNPVYRFDQKDFDAKMHNFIDKR
jgi:hypothetical protein